MSNLVLATLWSDFASNGNDAVLNQVYYSVGKGYCLYSYLTGSNETEDGSLSAVVFVAWKETCPPNKFLGSPWDIFRSEWGGIDCYWGNRGEIVTLTWGEQVRLLL